MKTFLRSTILSLFTLAILTASTLAQTLPEGEWRLEGYNFVQKIAFPIDKMAITMNVTEDGKFGGRSGCNVYGGNYFLEDEKPKFGSVFSTMMACEETEMQFERAFLTTLEAATKVEFKDGELTITDEKNASFMRFVAVEKRNKCRPSTTELN